MDRFLTKDYRQDCRYGSGCYQKNPEHKAKFKHPSDNKNTSEEKNDLDSSKSDIDTNKNKENKENVIKSPKKRQLSEGTDGENESKKKRLHALSSSEESQEEDDDKNDDDDASESTTKKEEKDDDAEDVFDDILPDSPKDIKEDIKLKFLASMPEDFYVFLDFCKSLNSSAPLDALLPAGLKLCGPFDILAKNVPDKAPRSQKLFLTHGRFYYDPPEMITVICEATYKTGFHIGYFRDSPKDAPVFLVSGVESEGCKLTILGDNIFAAVYHHLSAKIDIVDPFQRSKIKSLVEKIKMWVNRAMMEGNNHSLNLEKKSASMKNRDRLKVATTFHGAGMVVPYNKKTEVTIFNYVSLCSSYAQ